MKKILVFLIMAFATISFTASSYAKAVDINGNESFSIWNRCSNNEYEESFILFGYNSCTASVEMYSVVEEYAQSKGVTMYAVDGSLLGIREALGGGSLELPAIVVYNSDTRNIGGGDGITSKAMLEETADKILDEKNPEIKITINSDIMLCDGKEIKLDVPASIIEGRTMIPLRAVFEAIGAKITWDEYTKDIIAERGNIQMSLRAGSKIIEVNNFYETIDAPPVIIDGRTLVPVRAVTEPFGCKVSWDEKSRTVTIK